jgi:hypothetical protein
MVLNLPFLPPHSKGIFCTP